MSTRRCALCGGRLFLDRTCHCLAELRAAQSKSPKLGERAEPKQLLRWPPISAATRRRAALDRNESKDCALLGVLLAPPALRARILAAVDTRSLGRLARACTTLRRWAAAEKASCTRRSVTAADVAAGVHAELLVRRAAQDDKRRSASGIEREPCLFLAPGVYDLRTLRYLNTLRIPPRTRCEWIPHVNPHGPAVDP